MKLETRSETRTIDAGGRQLAWRSVGSGPPLVLVNGYAATADDWDPRFFDALAASFQVICPHNRGMGASDLGEPGELTVDAMAADVVRILDAEGLEAAPIAGWSMGGFVAQRVAVLAPRRVDALVLLSTDHGGPDAIPADAAVWRRLTDHAGSPREQASRMLALVFPPDLAPAVDREFGELVAGARAQLSEAALFAQEAAMDRWHAEAQPVTVADPPPALIACGDLDVVIPPANAEALALHFRTPRVEVFAGGGHAFFSQAPDRLASLIGEFLGR